LGAEPKIFFSHTALMMPSLEGIERKEGEGCNVAGV
jgi:hypothetical protein